MGRPICIPCNREYACHKNEVVVLIRDALYFGDEWRCPGCDHALVMGIAPQPFTYSDLPQFDETLRRYENQIRARVGKVEA